MHHQEAVDMLFSWDSVEERGTMNNLRNEFKHRSMPPDGKGSFIATENFFQFITEAYVVYLTMELFNMEAIGDDPEDLFTVQSRYNKSKTKKDRREFLKKIARRVVEEVWLLPSSADVNAVLEADLEERPQEWCVCDKGEKMRGVLVQ